MGLHTLSLTRFTEGTAGDRKRFATELVEAFQRDGFVKIVDHGLSDDTVLEFFNQFRSFFALSTEQRAAIEHTPGSDPQRGWSPVGAESTAALYTKGLLGKQIGANMKDAREHWDQGSEFDMAYPNRWPPEDLIPGFRSCLEDKYHIMESICGSIMTALEVGLDLARGSFTDRMTHNKNASELRCNHYPPVDIVEINKGTLNRIWPHFDLGVITLLFQDQVGGLQYENRTKAGEFCQVECGSPAELVVNVSETLQRWTNGVLPAGLHRVMPPPQMNDLQSGLIPARYSIAYFAKADRSASVAPLRDFVQEGCEPKFHDMTALEYHASRLTSAY